MTWINFYNIYGKKYGLNLLKSAPETCKDMKSSPEDMAKTISTMNYPQKINLNVIRGNWALVSVMDLDRTPKPDIFAGDQMMVFAISSLT